MFLVSTFHQAIRLQLFRDWRYLPCITNPAINYDYSCSCARRHLPELYDYFHNKFPWRSLNGTRINSVLNILDSNSKRKTNWPIIPGQEPSKCFSRWYIFPGIYRFWLDQNFFQSLLSHTWNLQIIVTQDAGESVVANTHILALVLYSRCSYAVVCKISRSGTVKLCYRL